jgi:hypothetical protein
MNVEALSKSLTVKSNDMMSAIYVASLVRSILALHKCAFVCWGRGRAGASRLGAAGWGLRRPPKGLQLHVCVPAAGQRWLQGGGLFAVLVPTLGACDAGPRSLQADRQQGDAHAQ